MAGEPIQGFDVTVSVIGPNGPVLVGSYEQIDINLNMDTEAYPELGSRVARQLSGMYEIDGTLRRGWRDMDIINTIAGASAIRVGDAIPEPPRFEVACNVNAPAKGLVGRIKLERCLFTKLGLSASAGKGVVKGDMPFKAEGISQG